MSDLNESAFLLVAEWKLEQLREKGDSVNYVERELRDSLNIYLLVCDSEEFFKKRKRNKQIN